MGIKTDLALEAREIYRKGSNREVPGVDVEVDDKYEGIKVTCVRVTNSVGSKIIGKPEGSYITIEAPGIRHYDGELHNQLSKVFAENLGSIAKDRIKGTTLVVGLGNWNVTPDALGPNVVKKLMITRHLKKYMPDDIEAGINPVCAISPGVLGITGIETAEIVQGVIDRVKPSSIIVIDALASRKIDRVATTIQIGDTGISPGSGIGNRRMEFSEASMGVPVYAVGIPTVVDGATMANDTIDIMIDEMADKSEKDSDFYRMLTSINKEEKYMMIKELLYPQVGDFVVTPKEIDSLIDNVSKIIADGINRTLHPDVDPEDMDRYLH